MLSSGRHHFLIVVVVGLALTATGSSLLFAEARTEDAQRHERLASRVRDALRSRVGVYVYGLRGARGVFTAHPDVSREEFHAYAQSREPAFEFPGAIGVGFIRRVAASDIPDLTATRRSEGLANFAVRPVPGKLGAIEAGRTHAYVIDYIEPFPLNHDAVGLDIGSEDHRREAADLAMVTGEPALTAPIVLVQVPREGPGYLYLNPVYRPGSYPNTVAERKAALMGWTYMPLVMRRIAVGLSEVSDGELDFEVFDGDAATGTLVYDDDNHLDGSVTPQAWDGREMVLSEKIGLGGRTWTLVTSTSPQFVYTSRLAAWLLLVGGCAFSLVLAWLVHSLAASRSRAEKLAAQMTLDLQAKSKELERLSLHDALTGLPNRVLLLDRVQQTLLRAARDGGLYALMFVDLDDFKKVNDTLGHHGGDLLLKTVAKRLRGALRASDTVSHFDTPNTVARLGGDEFVVLLQRLAAADDVRLVARRIIERVSAPVAIADRHVEVGASVGLVIGAERHQSADDLIREADLAMYEAKARGKGSVVVYGEEIAATGAPVAPPEDAGG